MSRRNPQHPESTEGPDPAADEEATGWPPRTSPGIDPGRAADEGETRVRGDDELARGEDGEEFVTGAPTTGSKGLGAIWGDPEWSPVDEPMSERARQERDDATATASTAYELHETESGERYLTDHGADEDDDPSR
ncbi:hypothetical protein GCM10011512_01710 [Tersicoccus solisilvae]|uniref:DUF5709 domain-containing protein n=1 Tax=Tersicoccus solisilvae TaxID=1882339 RepID=A0ABQ1NJG8_9MICC|nr:hypothetical protein [Tersicoccus solisilvae]GGC78755.1 hypothetical protein GCM10011512_01710 [Tersicoccus solisilvae]